MAQRAEQPADLRQRALALHRGGKPGEAKPLYTAYLSQRADDAQMWSNFGALMRAEGRLDQALRAQERAFALAPTSLPVLINFANALADSGRSEEALTHRRAVLEQSPDDAATKAMVGKALRSLGRYEEGIATLARFIREHPEETELKLQLALTQLAAGRYAEGFENYAVRWQTEELTPRRLPQPEWDGGGLRGKTIAVLPEQGFGDTIAFARFLPVLRQYGPERVLLHCAPPVLRLLQQVHGADWVGQLTPEGPRFDLWTDMMDLPTHHFASQDDIPAPARMAVPEDAVRRARSIAGPHGAALKVGVVWTGSLTYRGNAHRSFGHERFLPLADLPGVKLFSLYKGPAAEAFRADGSAAFILDAGSSDRDFADCAALMREMDLVVTSDTATAHLAGSLGVPVWVLLHWDAFWLWRHEGETTPWYPSMTLIRQPAPRDWDSVFAEVARRLAALTESRP